MIVWLARDLYLLQSQHKHYFLFSLGPLNSKHTDSSLSPTLHVSVISLSLPMNLQKPFLPSQRTSFRSWFESHFCG